MDKDNKKNNKKDEDDILIQKLKKNAEKIMNLKEIEKLTDEELRKRLSLDELDKLAPEIKNCQKKDFYKRFVNGLKNPKENNNKDAIKSNNEGQFMNMVNKMMDQILIKNNNLRNTINGNQNKLKMFDNDLKSILLIQKKYKEYKKKKISFEQMMKEKQNYLSFKQIKNKSKDELKIELIKSINKNKELCDIINYLKNKIEILEKKNKNLEKINTKEKTELGIEKQEDINIIKNELAISNNSNKNNSKEINDNNSILKKNKKQQSKKGKQRVSICDNKEQADNTKKINNLNNDSSKKLNNESKVLKTEIIENPKEKKERMMKSRGLRKLLTKKGKEKKDTLRKYFRKFYLAGLFVSIRQGLKQKTLDVKEGRTKRTKSVDQSRPVTTANRGDKYRLNDNDEDNEENEEINKIKMMKKLLLSKIVYRKDRVLTVILKKNFEKLNLRAKLISLQEAQKERLAKTKTKSKLRKKKIFKSKSVEQFEGDKYKKNNNDNNIGLIGKY